MLVFCGLLIFLSLTSGHNTSSNIASKLVRYYDGSGLLIGFVAWDKEKNTTNQPIILVVPDYNGRDEFENSKAVALAKLGYIGFAVDLYGNGSMGSSHNESIQMMTTYTKDRNKLLSRLRAAISATNSLHDGQHRLVNFSLLILFIL